MIVDLPSTTTGAVSKKMVKLRNDVGAMTLGRVLTLIIVVDESDADEAINAANDASRQHPCRIIALVRGNTRGANRLDAQIRVGGDAGASEVIVLRLYGALAGHGNSVVVPLLLPDSPVVAWWPKEAPADVFDSAIGQMAQRRITDSGEARNSRTELKRRADTYQPGDTDLAWTRVTLWRGLLAAALDQPPYEPVLAAAVTGGSDSPSTDLLAGWLALALKCPVKRTRTPAGTGTVSVRLTRRSGNLDLVRPGNTVATLVEAGQPVRRISLDKRQLAECLAEELRRLNPDEMYAETLTKGLAKVGARGSATTSGKFVRMRSARQLGSTKKIPTKKAAAADAASTKKAAAPVAATTKETAAPVAATTKKTAAPVAATTKETAAPVTATTKKAPARVPATIRPMKSAARAPAVTQKSAPPAARQE